MRLGFSLMSEAQDSKITCRHFVPRRRLVFEVYLSIGSLGIGRCCSCIQEREGVRFTLCVLFFRIEFDCY